MSEPPPPPRTRPPLLTPGCFWALLFAACAVLWILGVECGRPYWKPLPVYRP